MKRLIAAAMFFVFATGVAFAEVPVKPIQATTQTKDASAFAKKTKHVKKSKHAKKAKSAKKPASKQ